MPAQQRAERRPTLHMHPDDASARGLAQGGEVLVYNPRGRVSAVLHVSPDIMAGTVALPGKWWENMAAPNVLISPLYSPGGQPAYHDVYVEVAPDAARPGGRRQRLS